LLVNCDPDKASVQIDSETKGFSPTKIDDIGEGDRQLTISYPGYQSINVFVKAINGYTLVIEANLAKEKAPEPKVQEELIPSLAPLQNVKKAVIKQTETGWLRVRAEANANSAEVAKVKPNESYTVAEENGDWIKIQIDTTKSGWVSAKYVEIQK
ncbi:MAG TPA: SH3 domain-containing protein, partial [Patescibacteria group bacterium]